MKTLKNDILSTVKPMQATKKAYINKVGTSKGLYMHTLDKKKASKVMQARAFDRWNKASAKDRKQLGLALAQARKAKRQKALV